MTAIQKSGLYNAHLLRSIPLLNPTFNADIPSVVSSSWLRVFQGALELFLAIWQNLTIFPIANSAECRPGGMWFDLKE
jgi:hypothetical protein